MQKLGFVFATFIVILSCYSAEAEEVKKIQDNSFLLEEAYNQEDGVIQHISVFQYMKNSSWVYTFTQEWPVLKQKHQLSYTIPYGRVRGESGSTSGFGDIFLNYRYQLVMKEAVALAPRFSLILPTGSYREELGNGAVGFQGNIPLSVELSDSFVTHWNLGATYIPRAKAPDGSKGNTTGFNYGASIIWLASEHFNLMLESAGGSAERVLAGGDKERQDFFFSIPVCDSR